MCRIHPRCEGRLRGPIPPFLSQKLGMYYAMEQPCSLIQSYLQFIKHSLLSSIATQGQNAGPSLPILPLDLHGLLDINGVYLSLALVIFTIIQVWNFHAYSIRPIQALNLFSERAKNLLEHDFQSSEGCGHFSKKWASPLNNQRSKKRFVSLCIVQMENNCIGALQCTNIQQQNYENQIPEGIQLLKIHNKPHNKLTKKLRPILDFKHEKDLFRIPSILKPETI